MKFKIVFIGAGNLATHLAIKFYDLGHNIIQIYSRSEQSAKELAETINATCTTNILDVVDSADFYIFSVKDSVLESLIRDIPHSNGIWLHTAGSIASNIFEGRIDKYGVIYPLQTFTKNRSVEWCNIPVFIEGNTSYSFLKIERLANQLSTRLYPLTSEKRIYIHTSAVFACNFANFMYRLAQDLIEKGGLSFDVLLPLIDETSAKVHKLTPKEAQTGPAVRFDRNVIDKHLDALQTNREAKEIYKLVSECIHNRFKGNQ